MEREEEEIKGQARKKEKARGWLILNVVCNI